MRAAVIHEFGKPEALQVEDLPDPDPGPHEIIVRQSMTTVNHRDIWIRMGHPNPAFNVDLPIILGIDICGEVTEVGSEVDSPAVGDRVTINPYIPCERCDMCLRAMFQYCNNLNIYNGSYTELAVVPAKNAIPVPKELSDTQVACFGNNYPTAWEMLIRKARISPEDTVFVWAGTSGVGWAGIEIARLVGARVITSAGTEEKRQILRDKGLDVVDHYSPDMVARVMEMTEGRGVSVVFEHVGTDTWQRSVEMCRSNGAIVVAGATSGDNVTMNVIDMFVKQLRILGSRNADMNSALGAAEHLAQGAFDPIIGKELSLDDIAEAHRLLEQGKITGKIVIKF